MAEHRTVQDVREERARKRAKFSQQIIRPDDPSAKRKSETRRRQDKAAGGQ